MKKKSIEIEGEKYRVSAGDTWSSIAMKHYGDAMLGAALAELNQADVRVKPGQATVLILPAPDVLNRRLNQSSADNNPFGRQQQRHLLPLRGDHDDDENSVARDARARLARARVGMGLHAKGGGWRPTSHNAEDQKNKPKKKKRPEPELEDRWLRRLARLSPRSATKVAKVCGGEVGVGPTLTLLGNLREADNAEERLSLIERFLQAYASPAHETVKQLLRAMAWHKSARSDAESGQDGVTDDKQRETTER